MSGSATARSANTRRVVVQRCPVVPTEPKTMARTARSRSAFALTITALLPPSSSRHRPSRPATAEATRRPTAVEPVNETSGIRRSAASRAPISPPPTTRLKTPERPWSSMTRFAIRCTASAHSGACSDGFQISGSPQTAATAAFHDQTAIGKLKAVMTATGPSGCHCSNIRWPGRSEAMVSP